MTRRLLLLAALTLSLAAPIVQGLNSTGDAADSYYVGGYPESWWAAKFQALLHQSAAQGGDAAQLPTQNSSYIVGTYNLIVAHGYPAENHTVRTADGYLLGVFRIPRPGAPAVFLMHGLLASSADYVTTSKDRALGYLLYDAGYDVWMGNARGTTASKRHERLSPSDPAFWNFSWHEIGKLDLPACIDYVLARTNQSALHYVGHSQGTTTFFVLGSERPEYMAKVKTYIALAPVAFTRDIRSVPLRLFSMPQGTLILLLRLVGVNEFAPSTALAAELGHLLCAEDDPTQPVCFSIIFLIYGADTQQLDKEILPQVLVNTPAGASTKQLIHYAQLIDRPDLAFNKYDYGALGNLARYHNITPPSYDLSRVTALTYLFHSDNDILAVQSNVDELVRQLPNIAPGGVRRVPLAAFDHLDYLYARDVKSLLYDDVIDIIHNYEAALP